MIKLPGVQKTASALKYGAATAGPTSTSGRAELLILSADATVSEQAVIDSGPPHKHLARQSLESVIP
ncbi:MAG: hypothetical protein EBZ48_18050 [Proteobacteria bacterium]|nr:hypothetical protein [Pseudomonadota bacterium]